MNSNKSAHELKQELLYCWIIPPMICVLYGLSLWLMPARWRVFYLSEYGPVEIITAMMFAVMAGCGLVFALRLRRLQPDMPMIWRVWFWVFVVGAVFMFLEEISYGQHFIGFNSPTWFEARSKQQELNLHNLFDDKPSKIMRRIMEIGLPIYAIALPALLHVMRESYRKPRLTFYIAPRFELVMWTFLATLDRPVRHVTGLSGGKEWRGAISEFVELLWAGALLTYLWVMWRRLSKPAEPAPKTGAQSAA